MDPTFSSLVQGTTSLSCLPWLLACPFLTAAWFVLFARRLSDQGVWRSAMVAMTLTWLAANGLLLQWLFQHTQGVGPSAKVISYGTWLEIGGCSVPIAFVVDGLSASMAALVGWVAWLVQWFSSAYLAHDPSARRYNLLLHLFVGAMMLLVMSDSLPLLFAGWEGVGLCSALLVGFWYEQSEPRWASALAFVVNRIGDVGLMVAMMVLLAHGDLLPISQWPEQLSQAPLSPMITTGLALALLWAACGKSAQWPLYLWLPQAMVGPTPISALMHAATMVTAGIYLLLRTSPLLLISPIAQMVAAWIGGLTALLAALMALCQYDLKKILAFSTVSQLGLMMLAVGTGQFDGALFHLLTHAGGKAALFLAAGAILYHLHHEQDIRHMGQLALSLPKLRWPMVLAAASLAGLPLLGGFWSKDGILAGVWASQQGPLGGAAIFLYAMAWLTSLLTALYLMRMLIWLWWPPQPLRLSHPHADVLLPPRAMVWPITLLALFAAISGVLCLPPWLGGGAWLIHITPFHHDGHHLTLWTEVALMFAAIAASGMGLALAWWGMGDRMQTWRAIPWVQRSFAVFQVQLNYPKWTHASLYRPLEALAKVGCARMGEWLISAVERLVLALIRWTGFVLQLFQNGQLQRYIAVWLFALACLLLGWLAPWHTPSSHGPPVLQQEAMERPTFQPDAHDLSPSQQPSDKGGPG